MLFAMLRDAARIADRIGDDDFRAEVTIDALGARKSWSNLSKDEVSKIKLSLLAITRPDDLDSQLRGEGRRWVQGIESHGLEAPLIAKLAQVVGGSSNWKNFALPDLQRLRWKVAGTARSLRRRRTAVLLDLHGENADFLARLEDPEFFALCKSKSVE